jgi:hypothetical protein
MIDRILSDHENHEVMLTYRQWGSTTFVIVILILLFIIQKVTPSFGLAYHVARP